MTDLSAKLRLPFIQPSQAQKHVTHNEALLKLDALVQMSVVSKDLGTPPGAPVDGESYIVPTGAIGAWAGQDGNVAIWQNTAWVFYPPGEGWTAWVSDLDALWSFDGSSWVETAPAETFQNVPMVGVNATADATNRLSVNSSATLLNNDGADHRLKINKAAAGDTASVLFQSGWTDHAEIGLMGDTAWSLKVSADGIAWSDAISVDAAAQQITLGMPVTFGAATITLGAFADTTIQGRHSIAISADYDANSGASASEIRLLTDGVQRVAVTPSDMTVDVPIRGAAVQADPTDTTPERLLKVGAFGLGENAGVQLADVDLNTTSGYYFGYGGAHVGATPGVNPFPALNGAFGVVQGVSSIGAADEYMWQLAVAISGNLGPRDVVYRKRSTAANGWTPWAVLYSTANVVGAVSQSGGSPTGAVIERGSNADGEYVRFADGTQICTHTMTADAAAATTWTYPSPFTAAPVVSGTAVAPVLAALCLDAAPTATAAIISVRDKTDARRADAVHLQAIGRWF